MKVSRQQASDNRQAILQVAAVQLLERGFALVSVADVADAAGLTHGALYSHFKSKDALQAAAVERAFDDSVANFTGLTTEEFLGRYFSEQHRDHAGHGCPAAALASEMHAQTEAARTEFHAGFRRFAETLRGTLQSDGAGGTPDVTMLAFAAMVGTLALSRAVQGVDRALADTLLRAVGGQLREVLAMRSGRDDPSKPQTRPNRKPASPPGPRRPRRKGRGDPGKIG